MKEIIPVHKLNDRSASGLEIVRFDTGWGENDTPMDAHRDDHYIFLLQRSGTTDFMLDFKMLHIEGSAVLFILPGQVHHYISAIQTEGYFLALDTALVSEEYRLIFEQQILGNSPLPIDEERCSRIVQCAELLYQQYTDPQKSLRSVLNSLALSYIGMIAETYLQQTALPQKQHSRPMQLNGQFRSMLLKNFKQIKSPAEYAALLNISLTYLNEVVKDITGFPVSYWIHHEIILEAKRLLFYTKLSVKEISIELGFSDHTYFSRLFTKMAGTSAGKFRSSYR